MATVFIPALLRNYTGGRESVTAVGRTLGQIIKDLDRQFPGLASKLVEADHLKQSLAASVDGELAVAGLFEAVEEQSEIHFLPAISGGS
ncbi:MAG TPA: MoaD/ThiS family protein [Candidatus Binataceae bacterium]|nr:MoaD/ThiS family protein [Candidatus Binataceae bacterium]